MKTMYLFIIASLTSLCAYAQPQPVACYNFNGNLNEANGGTPLQALGAAGTYSVNQQVCTKDSVYSWKLAQGLKLPIGTTFPKNNYTIELLFKFVLPYPKSWQRIIDFNDNTLDQGLYTYVNNLQMYTQFTGTSNLAQPNTWFRLFVTRNAANDSMKGYINNNLEIQLKDIQQYGVFWNNLILFKDDIVVQGEEAAGSIDYLRIYNVALTKKQIDSIIVKSSAPNMILSSSSVNICKGQSVTLNASGASNYSWNNGSSTNTITVSPSTTTTYYVHGWNYSYCTKTCKDSDAVTIVVNPGLTLAANANNSICSAANGSATVSVSGSSGTFTYSWNNGQTTATATGLLSGVYTVTVTNTGGCSASTTVSVISIVSGTAGVGTVTNASCFGSANGSATASMSGGTSPYTYSWSNAATTATATGLGTGTYTVAITDANGCSSTTTVTITEPTALTAAAAATATSCGLNNGTANVNVSGGTVGYTYLWSNGATQSSINNLQSTIYTVTITDANGCSATATTTVNGSTAASVNFTASDTAGCGNPFCATFTCTSSNIALYSWDFGDGNNSSSSNPNHCYKNSGVYSVTLFVTDNNGCTATMTKSGYITVFPNPVADFSANPQPTTMIDPMIHFSDLSIGASTWLWNFGEMGSSSSTLQNPIYSYKDTGCFTASLKVENQYGCKDSIEKPVCIKSGFTFYAPNAFTPNANGLNDLFMPMGTGIDGSDFSFMIFDRWGNLIWQSRTWGEGWDGKAGNGQHTAQTDVYVWKCLVKEADSGKKHSYVGHVTLVK